MGIRILIAEDDPAYLELVGDILRKEGYEVIEAPDGERAMELFFQEKSLDLLLLDVMMPKADGWEVLRTVRKHSDIPVIMLTALGDEGHEVIGLRQGADDYISKPFSYSIFIARINAALREKRKTLSDEISAGTIRMDGAGRKVFLKNEEITLNHKEFELLKHFLKNKNRVFSREQLLDQLWGFDFDGDARTVDTHIKMLRAKLGEEGDRIKTIRGIGYSFEVIDHEN